MTDPTQTPAGTPPPGSEGQKPGSTPPGADSIVKEPLTWWEQKLQALPPAERDAIIGKIKGYDVDYARGKQRIAEREREVSEVAEKLQVAARQPQPSTQEQGEARLLIDSLVNETTDPAQRETLRTLRTVVEQLSRKQLEEVENKLRQEFQSKLTNYENATQMTRFTTVQKELRDLSKDYGMLVDKYGEQVLAAAGQNPTLTTKKILFAVADPDDLEQALDLQRRKSTEQPKPKAASAQSITSTEENKSVERFRGKSSKEILAGRKLALQEKAQEVMRRVGLAV